LLNVARIFVSEDGVDVDDCGTEESKCKTVGFIVDRYNSLNISLYPGIYVEVFVVYLQYLHYILIR
jgi:hypothetical protein